MRKKYRPGTSRARIGRLGTGLLATISAFCLLLVMTTAAFANTVNIYDRAGVLDQSRVNSAGSALSYPADIYTVNNFSGSTSSFDQTAKGSINSSNKIVIAIDTVHQHLTIVGGRSVSLSNNQYADARNAFATSFRNDKNYTSATVAALQSLQGASGNGAFSVPGVNGGGFSWASGLCCVGLIVVAAVLVFGVLSRRRRGGGGGFFGRRPNYDPNYNQFNQPYNQGGYPQNYGPNYPGGYNQNQGMNPWAAGGLGAAAGGLVGYELGKQAGEGDERGDQGNFGNDQGGFGGGASGDFGGGNNNGGDQGGFGGGASGDFGGGDNSGGGGGDFGGGGGGGDFGGGGGGSF